MTTKNCQEVLKSNGRKISLYPGFQKGSLDTAKMQYKMQYGKDILSASLHNSNYIYDQAYNEKIKDGTRSDS